MNAISNEAVDQSVLHLLSDYAVSFKGVYIGEVTDPFTSGNTTNRMDMYQIVLAKQDGYSMTIPYYMGLGNRVNKKPKAPVASGVLHNLLAEASALDQNFLDWASDLGFDTDSLKALSTYNSCCAMGKELYKIFTTDQIETLKELLQDY